ncbi:hemerythrin domain-containing protein [Mycolicibacterium aichiense]|uniref:Hemerythrin n=1 Tax=Mycolicibacterium aichiense TaxID=1799 RepID=A0AAD1MC78_9MYCO|nr:hemerythrin domain-containing protein [Mycolicibacterium aichiense]MCV7019605.1 hemerythrin domain-containing protein [Mycolicibacterium aichiense]BBX07024.1 hemerythrin [Mycolicibacterium aichiense]STZ80840.1 hemerythrin HHE cation binding domain-containing protein [Mycolicibacterium aichiense]
MVETFVQSTTDVVDFLKHQHNLIKDMFDDVLSASESKAREKAFVDLRQLLAVHETAEEMVVHPRARHELTDGDNIVDARIAEEHEAKEQLSALEKMDVDSQEFLDELMKFRDAVVEHAEREENEEFSQLQAELDDEALERMAGAVRAAEAIAPTRPHAGVESAVLNFAVGPFASMLDRARDAISAAIK